MDTTIINGEFIGRVPARHDSADRGTSGRFLPGNPGGTGGARPGAGRPASATRAACRQSFEDRIGALERIIDDPQSRPADRISAMALLAKIGLPAQAELSGPEGEPVKVAGAGGDEPPPLAFDHEAFALAFQRLVRGEALHPEGGG